MTSGARRSRTLTLLALTALGLTLLVAGLVALFAPAPVLDRLAAIGDARLTIALFGVFAISFAAVGVLAIVRGGNGHVEGEPEPRGAEGSAAAGDDAAPPGEHPAAANAAAAEQRPPQRYFT